MAEQYTPSTHSLQFIAFIRACATEDNANAEIVIVDGKQVVIHPKTLIALKCI